MIRALTFFSACLCTCWFLLANASQAHDPNATIAEPLAAAPPTEIAEPRSTAVVAPSTREHDAPSSAARADEEASTPAAASSRAVQRAVGHLSAPIPYVAKRLGIPRDDPRLVFLSDWLADRRVEEHRLTERVSQLGGADQRAAMQAFNAAGDTWRRMLVQQVGYDLASQVVDTFCMYRFDAAEGSWHRVNAVGDRVAFLHEDDDIWQRGESSNPGWEGHW